MSVITDDKLSCQFFMEFSPAFFPTKAEHISEKKLNIAYKN